MGTSATRDDLELLLAPVVTAAGLDLEAVEVERIGRRQVVRVFVDRDGGIDLDTVAEVSRAVSGTLDDSDLIGTAPYVLEVSSPGVDRPLTQPRHWRRARGRLVRVGLTGGDATTGRLLDADETGIDLAEGSSTRRLGFAEIATGRVEVEFNRPLAGPDQDEEG